eukprot:TRINITY_DN18326_c0_g1_i3.p1 TRINITY_DN18326_c0_g1~~TRINITY_DN18326_c0_g1_i3.p1  ORF type:complete len:301 (+),score=73.14 TRINITY_DN18326_c0_g1_i3:139-1041(+)
MCIRDRYGDHNLPVYGFEVGPALYTTYERKVITGGPNKDDQVTFIRKDGGATPDTLTNVRDWNSPAGTPGKAPWHPAWKEHRYQGLMLGHFLLKQLQKAIPKAEAEVSAGPFPVPIPTELPWYPKDWKDKLAGPLSRTCSQHDMRCDLPLQCATEYLPRRGHSLTEIRATETWLSQISPGDKIPYDENLKVGSGYVDNKMAFCGWRRDGWIAFHLHHASPQGTLIVCEPSYGWKRPDNVALLKEGAIFKVNADEVKPRAKQLINEFCFEMDTEVPKGGSIFSIRSKSDEKQVCVSFLIWT